MILFIPYTRFTLKTYLPAHEAKQRLAADVEPRKLFRWGFSRDHKFFTGIVKNHKFNINRTNHYRAASIPIVIGQIHDNLVTSRIEITMRLNNIFIGIAALILPFWLSTAYIFFSFHYSSKNGIKSLTIFIGSLIIFYGVGMAFFNLEANKARRHLEEIFQVHV